MNGQGLDLGALANRAAQQEANAAMMLQGFIASTASAIYSRHVDIFGSIDEDYCRGHAKNSHLAARVLAEEVFGVKIERRG